MMSLPPIRCFSTGKVIANRIDKYQELLQMIKTTKELITLYGYEGEEVADVEEFAKNKQFLIFNQENRNIIPIDVKEGFTLKGIEYEVIPLTIKAAIDIAMGAIDGGQMMERAALLGSSRVMFPEAAIKQEMLSGVYEYQKMSQQKKREYREKLSKIKNILLKDKNKKLLKSLSYLLTGKKKTEKLITTGVIINEKTINLINNNLYDEEYQEIKDLLDEATKSKKKYIINPTKKQIKLIKSLEITKQIKKALSQEEIILNNDDYYDLYELVNPLLNRKESNIIREILTPTRGKYDIPKNKEGYYIIPLTDDDLDILLEETAEILWKESMKYLLENREVIELLLEKGDDLDYLINTIGYIKLNDKNLEILSKYLFLNIDMLYVIPLNEYQLDRLLSGKNVRKRGKRNEEEMQKINLSDKKIDAGKYGIFDVNELLTTLGISGENKRLPANRFIKLEGGLLVTRQRNTEIYLSKMHR